MLHGRRGIKSRATESLWQGPLTKTILNVNWLINGSLSVSEFQVHRSIVCFFFLMQAFPCDYRLFMSLSALFCYRFFFLALFVSVVD